MTQCDGACGACGRALAACEWCGTSDVLRGPEGQRWPAVIRPGRPGVYHDPCYAEEQEILRAGRRAAGLDGGS